MSTLRRLRPDDDDLGLVDGLPIDEHWDILWLWLVDAAVERADRVSTPEPERAESEHDDAWSPQRQRLEANLTASGVIPRQGWEP